MHHVLFGFLQCSNCGGVPARVVSSNGRGEQAHFLIVSRCHCLLDGNTRWSRSGGTHRSCGAAIVSSSCHIWASVGPFPSSTSQDIARHNVLSDEILCGDLLKFSASTRDSSTSNPDDRPNRRGRCGAIVGGRAVPIQDNKYVQPKAWPGREAIRYYNFELQLYRCV